MWKYSLIILFLVTVCTMIFYSIRYFYYCKRIQHGIDLFEKSAPKADTMETLLWDLSTKIIPYLNFVDCVVYLVDDSIFSLVQKSAFGPKCKNLHQINNEILIPIGHGITGNAALSMKAEIIDDITLDQRYIPDEGGGFSELAVPIIHNQKVIGVIDSEHPKKGFFTMTHLAAVIRLAEIAAPHIFRLRILNEKSDDIATDSEANKITDQDLPQAAASS